MAHRPIDVNSNDLQTAFMRKATHIIITNLRLPHRLRHAALWLCFALPAVFIIYSDATHTQGYGWTLKMSGQWAVWFLIGGLCVTPLRKGIKRIWPRYNSAWIQRLRRPMGVAMFGYTALHLGVYLARKANARRIFDEGVSWDLGLGWLAFTLAIPLFITSTDRARRRLGKSWSRLHKLVYPIAIFTAIHWILTAFNPTTAYIVTGLIAVLLLLRLRLPRRSC